MSEALTKTKMGAAVTPAMAQMPQSECGDDDIPTTMDAASARDSMKEILEKSGADKACITDANNYFDNYSTSGSAEGNMKMLSGLAGNAGFNANFQTSGSTTETASSSEGCSQLIAQAATTIMSTRAISCAVQNSATESTGIMVNKANVRVEIDKDGCSEMLGQRLEFLNNIMDNATRMMVIAPDIARELLITFNAAVIAESDPKNPRCGIQVVDSVLKASVDAKMKVTTQNTLKQNNQLKASIQEAVSNEAKAALDNSIGATATEAIDTKQITDQYVESRKETIQTSVLNSASRTKAEVTSTGEVVIRAPELINLTGTTIDASIATALTTAAIMSAASEAGLSLATDILSEAATDSSQSLTTEQVDGIVKAMGDANAAAVKAQMDGHAEAVRASRMGSMMMYAAIGVVAVVAMKMMQRGGFGFGGGSYGPPQYDPVKCQGFKSFPEQFGRYYKIVGVISLIVKVHFILFVFKQVGKLMKHSTQLLTPWNWGKLDVGTYLMNVVWSIIAFMLYCKLLHNTANIGKCFGLTDSRVDPGNCYLGPDGGEDYGADSEDEEDGADSEDEEDDE